MAEFLELTGNAHLQYQMALPGEERDLLQIVTSNRLVVAKSVELTLSPPFNEAANRFQVAGWRGVYRKRRLPVSAVSFSFASPRTASRGGKWGGKVCN